MTEDNGSPKRGTGNCPYCISNEAVYLELQGSPNQEQVTWCAAGHVVITQQGMTPKLVFDFHKESNDE